MENKIKKYDYEDDHTKEIKEIINGKIYYMADGTLNIFVDFCLSNYKFLNMVQ